MQTQKQQQKGMREEGGEENIHNAKDAVARCAKTSANIRPPHGDVYSKTTHLRADV